MSESKKITGNLLNAKFVLDLPFLWSDDLLSLVSQCDVNGGVNQALPFAQLGKTGGKKGEDPAGFNRCFMTLHVCVPSREPVSMACFR